MVVGVVVIIGGSSSSSGGVGVAVCNLVYKQSMDHFCSSHVACGGVTGWGVGLGSGEWNPQGARTPGARVAGAIWAFDPWFLPLVGLFTLKIPLKHEPQRSTISGPGR